MTRLESKREDAAVDAAEKIAGPLNANIAPYPHELAQVIHDLRYRPGWSFELHSLDRGQGSTGLTLSIYVRTVNGYDHDQKIAVHHPMPVPPAAYDERSWQRWVFEQIMLVERHEAAEFFAVAGVHPYAPSHGPGNDPYLLREVGTDIDQRTSFRGEVNSS